MAITAVANTANIRGHLLVSLLGMMQIVLPKKSEVQPSATVVTVFLTRMRHNCLIYL